MALFQVQVNANHQTRSSEIEAEDKDKIIEFYDRLSVAEVLKIRRYVYVNPDKPDSIMSYTNRYASVTVVFDNRSPIKLKIPSLKVGISDQDIIAVVRNLYRNVKDVYVTIRNNLSSQ